MISCRDVLAAGTIGRHDEQAGLWVRL